MAVALITCGCSNGGGGASAATTSPAVTTAEAAESGESTPDATLAGEVRVGDGTGSYDPDDITVPDLVSDQGPDSTEEPANEPADTEEELAPGTHEGEPPTVGGQVTYSPEDIQQWLSPDELGGRWCDFDIGQMLSEIWGLHGIQRDNVGTFEYYYENGDFRVVMLDGNNGDGIYHKVKTTCGNVNGNDGNEYVSFVEETCYDSNSELYYVFPPDWARVINADLAVLIYKMAIEIEENPNRDNVLNGYDLGGNFNAY